MKERFVRFLVFSSLSICLFSCSNGHHMPAKELVQACNIMQTRPDSALVLLESILFPEKMNKPDYAYYCMLLTEARDKTFYKFTSDSTILVALDYYKATANKFRLSEAYYYMGRVSNTLNNVPQAIYYYLKAKDALGKDADRSNSPTKVKGELIGLCPIK